MQAILDRRVIFNARTAENFRKLIYYAGG